MAAVITQHLAYAIARRGFCSEPLTFSGCLLGLGRATVAALTELSPLPAVSEIPLTNNIGYLRRAGIWTVADSADGPVARFTVEPPTFQNAGAQDWEPARCLFLIGNVGDMRRLLWVSDVTPFSLEPGQSVQLTDNRVEIPWKSRAE
jgi:hypothetical protein